MPNQVIQHGACLRVSALTRRRSAVSLLETVVAVALAATLLTALAEMTLLVKRQTAILQERDLVLLQLENVLDEAALLSWEELNSVQVQQLESWQSIRRLWPAAEIDVHVSLEEHPAPAKQIALEFWLTPKRVSRPVRLTGWVFRQSAVD